MNNDLISREALRNVILNDRKLDGANANWEVNRILVHIENAPTVPQINIFCENADEKAIADMKEELQKVINDIRPQGEWIENNYGKFRCSICKGIAIYTMTGCLMDRHLEQYKTQFCPWCGADMRKGGAE